MEIGVFKKQVIAISVCVVSNAYKINHHIFDHAGKVLMMAGYPQIGRNTHSRVECGGWIATKNTVGLSVVAG